MKIIMDISDEEYNVLENSLNVLNESLKLAIQSEPLDKVYNVVLVFIIAIS